MRKDIRASSYFNDFPKTLFRPDRARNCIETHKNPRGATTKSAFLATLQKWTKKVTKRLKMYIGINSFIVAIAFLSYKVAERYGAPHAKSGIVCPTNQNELASEGEGSKCSAPSHLSPDPAVSDLALEACLIYVMGLVRMLSTVLYFEAARYLGGLSRIHPDKDSSREDFWGCLQGVFFIAGLMEVVNMLWTNHVMAALVLIPSTTTDYLVENLAFIPKSLCLELLFDLGHYWTHRLCHKNKTLFLWTHAAHHVHTHCGPLSCYSQTYGEIILTNFLPLQCALYFGPRLTVWQFHLFLSYKTFIEVAGHSGLTLNGPSFPQFPFLGWCTSVSRGGTSYGVVLLNQEHEWHHFKPTSNFSKRFSVWDRLFGTYEQPRFDLHAKR